MENKAFQFVDESPKSKQKKHLPVQNTLNFEQGNVIMEMSNQYYQSYNPIMSISIKDPNTQTHIPKTEKETLQTQESVSEKQEVQKNQQNPQKKMANSQSPHKVSPEAPKDKNKEIKSKIFNQILQENKDEIESEEEERFYCEVENCPKVIEGYSSKTTLKNHYKKEHNIIIKKEKRGRKQSEKSKKKDEEKLAKKKVKDSQQSLPRSLGDFDELLENKNSFFIH